MKDSRDFLVHDVLGRKTGTLLSRGSETRLEYLRKERVDKPTIFVGAGTCGLGAGAGKTIEAVERFLKVNKIDAEIIETGCIGLCSSEPIMDVQLPGRNRISFEKVTDDHVDGILSSIFDGIIVREDFLLGQFSTGKNSPWDGVRDIMDHPFFRPQKRLVLKNCGIRNPICIEEYMAAGGYGSYMEVLRNHKPLELCDKIEKSGLRGRGGGGFPTGRKWKFARRKSPIRSTLFVMQMKEIRVLSWTGL